MITPEEIARPRELKRSKDTQFNADSKNSRQAIIVGELDLQYLIDAANALPALLDEIERLRGLADHTDDQIKLTGMRAELNQLSLELDMARRDRDKAEAERDAALKRAEALQEALKKEKRLSDEFYLLLVDNPETKLMADQLMIKVFGGAKCHADTDGDCTWSECHQNRDGEPKATGRSCPLRVRNYEE